MVGLDSAKVAKLCEEAAEKSGQPISIANYLVDGNYAVSGAAEACAKVIELAPGYGARMAIPLAVAGAFHTSFMEPAVGRLREALAAATISAPRLPVISNVDAAPHWDPNDIRETLARQVTSPVMWENTIAALVKSPEFNRAYEIGPGSVCRGIVKRFGKTLKTVGVTA